MPKTIKIILVLAALNLIVLGSCFYLFIKIKKIDEVVSARLIQVESEVKKDESLRSTKKLMEDTKREREQIVSLFVGPNGAVEFIETVESLGRVADVKLTIESVGVEALKDKKAEKTESFRLAVKTEGSWVNTIHLLSLLEGAPFKISFSNVNLEKISSESNLVGGGENLPSYWAGNFTFNVLKIKNLPGKSVKIDQLTYVKKF